MDTGRQGQRPTNTQGFSLNARTEHTTQTYPQPQPLPLATHQTPGVGFLAKRHKWRLASAGLGRHKWRPSRRRRENAGRQTSGMEVGRDKDRQTGKQTGTKETGTRGGRQTKQDGQRANHHPARHPQACNLGGQKQTLKLAHTNT